MYDYATTPEARRAMQIARYERAMMFRAVMSWLFLRREPARKAPAADTCCA